jgi:hypothetical protein
MHPHCGFTLLWFIQPLPLLSLTFYLPLPIFQQLSTHILLSSTLTDVVFYNIVDDLSYSSFISFPEFYRVVSLLQISSIYEFVYEHACFYVYVYLLDLFST